MARPTTSHNLKLLSSILSTKYSALFVRPPITETFDEYLTFSALEKPCDDIFTVFVNVLIPVVVCISLFLKKPTSSTNTLSILFLLTVVLNFCNPPPLDVNDIVPIPASALVFDSDK